MRSHEVAIEKLWHLSNEIDAVLYPLLNCLLYGKFLVELLVQISQHLFARRLDAVLKRMDDFCDELCVLHSHDLLDRENASAQEELFVLSRELIHEPLEW